MFRFSFFSLVGKTNDISHTIKLQNPNILQLIFKYHHFVGLQK